MAINDGKGNIPYIIIEMRDPYTAGHKERVSELAVEIGKKFNFKFSRKSNN